MEDTDALAGAVWPELEVLAQPARERRRLSPETRSRIVLDLCARAPLSVKELSQLLERSEAYIGDAIRPLVTSGALTFLYPDQPRHPKQKYVTASAERTVPALAPVAAPAPTAAPVPSPSASSASPSPAPSPTSPPSAAPSAPDAVEPSSSPSKLANAAVVLVAGVLLCLLRVRMWGLYAIAAAVILASGHVLTNSSQYTHFRSLQTSRSRVAFVLLKAGVALLEIAIVYLITSAFRPSD